MKKHIPTTACKQYCLAAGATQGNIAYTQNVMGKAIIFALNSRIQRNKLKNLILLYGNKGIPSIDL